MSFSHQSRKAARDRRYQAFQPSAGGGAAVGARSAAASVARDPRRGDGSGTVTVVHSNNDDYVHCPSAKATSIGWSTRRVRIIRRPPGE